MKHTAWRATRGLTVIELIVVVAVSAVLVAIAVPSLSELIATQRLRSINAELVTDLQFARSQAMSGNSIRTWVEFKNNGTMSCYSVFLDSISGHCDCTQPAGSRCPSPSVEIRTVQVPASTDVQLNVTSTWGPAFHFTRDGGIFAESDFKIATTRISGAPGQYLNTVGLTGRPSACYSATTGIPSC